MVEVKWWWPIRRQRQSAAKDFACMRDEDWVAFDARLAAGMQDAREDNVQQSLQNEYECLTARVVSVGFTGSHTE